MEDYHVPVMLQEVMDGLQIKPSGIYVDCTYGGGGHSAAILERLDPSGKLIAFDQDEEARKNSPPDSRLIFIPHNFRHLQRFLRLHNIQKLDGIMADLGVSSYQFNTAARGFSTRTDGPLDMRMDQRQELTAGHILKNYSEERLQKIFEQFGEVTNSKTLARTIIQQRAKNPISRISEFKNAVHALVKGNPNKYFAQVFQALRIEVNDEMGSLQMMLHQLPELMKNGGRIAIITFHSLEDRLVKTFMKSAQAGNMDGTDRIYGTKAENIFQLITKKPMTPQPGEIKNNPRARSAKLRIAEKI
ncbi:MAG: 16S rRNA (cytosine(1402)-N(4))-methyltransferase RsmH [Ginsengibacter sp.]